jgi:hypothetical protein
MPFVRPHQSAQENLVRLQPPNNDIGQKHAMMCMTYDRKLGASYARSNLTPMDYITLNGG